MRIRQVSIDDAAAVAQLITSLGYPTAIDAMRTRLSAILKHTDYTGLVAFQDELALGFIGMVRGLSYERSGWYGRIIALSVAPAAQGQGVGRALVEAVELRARKSDLYMLAVSSGLQRIDAHAFYESVGFMPTGRAFYKTLT